MQTSANRFDSQPVRYCALSLGILFLLLGLAGFVPAFSAIANPVSGYGHLFGIFPTNYFHNAIGVLVGLWGIAASTSVSGSIVFNQIFAIVYAAHAILGLLPFTNTLFGTMPLYGNNIWFNAILSGVAYYYGFVKPGTSAIGMSNNV